MAVKVAINGLGRIGRCVTRIIADRDDIELVAANASGTEEMLEYNLKYDSVHGRRNDVSVANGYLNIADTKAKIFAERELSKIDFASTGAEIVLECTGAFLSAESVQPYLENGVKKNEDEYAGETVVSNASCTTNGLAPVAKVLNDAFGIEKGLMTTIHSYTASQPILDTKHKKDPRKGRSGAINIVPTTTGAAKAIAKVLPVLAGKLNGQALRVPTPDVSMVDLTVTLNKEITLDEVKQAFTTASQGSHKGILGVDEEYRVSQDFVGEELSTVVAMDTIQVIGGNMVKVLSWYDNEWGYSCRLVDMAIHISKKA